MVWMVLLAILIVCLIWSIILLLLRIHIQFAYFYHQAESTMQVEIRLFWLKTKFFLQITREMFWAGLEDLIDNLIKDLEEQSPLQEEAEPKGKRKSSRYVFLKKSSAELKRHHLTPWQRALWLKEKLSGLKKDFFKGIRIESCYGEIQIGTSDAARTGFIAGSMGAVLGFFKARCYRLFQVKAKNIVLQVVPRFDARLLICKLNCIFSLKISHIIFTAIKFLVIILKNRRIRNYG